MKQWQQDRADRLENAMIGLYLSRSVCWRHIAKDVEGAVRQAQAMTRLEAALRALADDHS